MHQRRFETMQAPLDGPATIESGRRTRSRAARRAGVRRPDTVGRSVSPASRSVRRRPHTGFPSRRVVRVVCLCPAWLRYVDRPYVRVDAPTTTDAPTSEEARGACGESIRRLKKRGAVRSRLRRPLPRRRTPRGVCPRPRRRGSSAGRSGRTPTVPRGRVPSGPASRAGTAPIRPVRRCHRPP